MAVHAVIACTTATDVRSWLYLLNAPGLGPAAFHDIIARFGSPEAALAAGADELYQAGLIKVPAREFLRRPAPDAIATDLAWLDDEGHHLLTCLDPDFPPLLREIPAPPPLLFVNGRRKLLPSLQIAVVGSRNPSPRGRDHARQFAREFSAHGLTVTSGLACGIDTAAHRGALDAGGATIAVTGTGLDRVYPATNRELARTIARGGALVSEFPTGTAPRSENFPRRNRIISGLSLGTLVVEAGVRSGSLITARLAADQGREVFAIPGAIDNPLARGCHALIRTGAKLVECGRDCLEELDALARACTAAAENPVPTSAHVTPEHARVLAQVDYAPTSIDTVILRTGLTAARVSSILLALEMEDLVTPAPGGTYLRTGERT